MKKVVVTGGAGFIGSNLVDTLIDDDIDVIVIDNLSTGKIENVNKSSILKHDLSSIEVDILINILHDVDVVFHLAALARVQPSIEDPFPYHSANVNVTLNLLYAVHKSKVKRLIYSASSSCYGDTLKFHSRKKILLILFSLWFTKIYW